MGLIDNNGNWIGEDTILVQLGDVCDRGDHSKEIFSSLMKWQNQAPDFGSALYFIIGNHEIMNIFGHYEYNGPNEYADFETITEKNGEKAHHNAFFKGGWLYKWLIKQHAVLKIDTFIFGHGDLPITLYNCRWNDLNRSIIDDLRSTTITEFMARPPMTLYDPENSILWGRQGQMFPVPDYESYLADFLSLNEATLYICGHTPSENGRFKLLHNNRYLCVDSGVAYMPYGAGGEAAVTIENNILKAHYFESGSIITDEILNMKNFV